MISIPTWLLIALVAYALLITTLGMMAMFYVPIRDPPTKIVPLED